MIPASRPLPIGTVVRIDIPDEVRAKASAYVKALHGKTMPVLKYTVHGENPVNIRRVVYVLDASQVKAEIGFNGILSDDFTVEINGAFLSEVTRVLPMCQYPADDP